MMLGKVMAIDLGTVRIGIAVSDGLQLCANPLTVVRSKGVDADLEAVSRLAAEHEITRFVVGLPLNMDDSESEGSRRARAFAERLSEMTGLPVELRDERLSTVDAQEALRRGATKRKKRRSVIDMAAATVILQDYLDSLPK
jgi:putative holliday junction resolvase